MQLPGRFIKRTDCVSATLEDEGWVVDEAESGEVSLGEHQWLGPAADLLQSGLRGWLRPLSLVGELAEMADDLPFIIVGAIIFGVATPTESAAVAAFYVLFLGLLVYRNLSIIMARLAVERHPVSVSVPLPDLRDVS